MSASWDASIRIWDIESGNTVVGPVIGHQAAVDCVSVSPDGRKLVTGSDDNTLRIWDAQTGKPLVGPMRGHGAWVSSVGLSAVSSVAFSPDGRSATRPVTGNRRLPCRANGKAMP